VFSLFKDSFPFQLFMLGYVILNDRAVVNYDLETLWKEKKRVVPYLKLLSWNLVGVLSKTIHNISHDG
jgi:hypothetical protein